MRHTALADRYAKAVLQLAREAGQVEAAGNELERLAAITLGEQKARTFWRSAKVPADDKQHTLQDVLEAMSAQAMIRNTANLLLERGRFFLLPEMAACYRTRALELTGVLEATVTSSAALSEQDLVLVSQGLAASFGKTIRLSAEISPDLLGGIQVRIGNTVIDGSVRGRLNAMGRVFEG
jgi:F-type H+-transporting ATPase subunit delta